MNRYSFLRFTAVALLAAAASACAADPSQDDMSEPSEASDVEVDGTLASDNADDEAVDTSESALPRCVTMTGHYINWKPIYMPREVVKIHNACGATVGVKVFFGNRSTIGCSRIPGHTTKKYYDAIPMNSVTFKGCPI